MPIAVTASARALTHSSPPDPTEPAAREIELASVSIGVIPAGSSGLSATMSSSATVVVVADVDGPLSGTTVPPPATVVVADVEGSLPAVVDPGCTLSPVELTAVCAHVQTLDEVQAADSATVTTPATILVDRRRRSAATMARGSPRSQRDTASGDEQPAGQLRGQQGPPAHHVRAHHEFHSAIRGCEPGPNANTVLTVGCPGSVFGQPGSRPRVSIVVIRSLPDRY